MIRSINAVYVDSTRTQIDCELYLTGQFPARASIFYDSNQYDPPTPYSHVAPACDISYYNKYLYNFIVTFLMLHAGCTAAGAHRKTIR